MPLIYLSAYLPLGPITYFTAGPDKIVICGGNPNPFQIVAVLPDPTNIWTISGNYASLFIPGEFITVAYNTGNIDPPSFTGGSHEYAVLSAVDNGPNTDITVNALTPIQGTPAPNGLLWIQDVVLEATVIGVLTGHNFLWEHLASGEVTIDCGGTVVNPTISTGLPNTTQVFSAIVDIDGTPTPVNIQGQDAQTFGDFVFQLNSQMGAGANATYLERNLVIRSTSSGPTSTIAIQDLNLFSSTDNFVKFKDQLVGSNPVTWKGVQTDFVARYTASVIDDRWFRFWIDKGTSYEQSDLIYVVQTPTSYFRFSSSISKFPVHTYLGASTTEGQFREVVDGEITTGDSEDCRMPPVYMVPLNGFPLSGASGFDQGPPYLFIYGRPRCRAEDVEEYQVQESDGTGWTTVATTSGPSSYNAVTGRSYRVRVKYRSQYPNTLNNKWIQVASDDNDDSHLYVESHSKYASPTPKVYGAVGATSRFVDPQGTEFQTIIQNYDVLVRILTIADWTIYPELDDPKHNRPLNQREIGQSIGGTLIDNYTVAGGAQIGG